MLFSLQSNAQILPVLPTVHHLNSLKTGSVGEQVPRASQYLVLAAKAKAVVSGRFTPNIDDIKEAMIPVLRHRIITNFSAEADGISSVDVINKIREEI
jgi:MoxR-like ATPase